MIGINKRKYVVKLAFICFKCLIYGKVLSFISFKKKIRVY